MTIPTATYRIQFRNGMTFDRAAELAPYLRRLGISHLYASPIFTATSGSTHGYDVTNANEIDPSIGGVDGFERMLTALKSHGLGLILDIVPNHMAASLENPWWRDVVEYGDKSPFARHFDIDWSRPLTLPFLGDTFEAALEAGDLSIKPDPDGGAPALTYFDTHYPLSPASYVGRETDILAITDRQAIRALHKEQPYRLMSWREAPNSLSYRRFFEITSLAGVRVEDDQVFDDTHRLILELVRDGKVDGLRIDHVDGLADPKAYLERLRQEVGPDCYLTVEKILAGDEQMPSDWPISGTTGYEFIATLSNAFVDDAGRDTLVGVYRDTVGGAVDVEAELRDAKLLMVTRNFAGETDTLLKLAMALGEADDENFDLVEHQLMTALRELLIAFPVYRSYGTEAGLPETDKTLLASVLDKVRAMAEAPDARALALLERILLGEVKPELAGKAGFFRTRFQQLTGPLMAKSVEDTLFFRDSLALALNEVGAEPVHGTFSLERFHDEMARRQELQPDGLSGTSTHDTKRGEDARARLYAISEAPELWGEAVARWREMNKDQIETLDSGPAPEPAVEWMLYQSLAGAWPVDLDRRDADGLEALSERFAGYVEKALREAKQRTNWIEPDTDYEKAVLAYAGHLLSPDNRDFLSDFAETIQPFIAAGLLTGLSQTLVKLVAPGVPDIYQGSEGLDLSLVDPDNRREPDFASLRDGLETELDPGALTQSLGDGRLKQRIVQKLLRLRQEQPDLMRNGRYIPLAATGSRAGHLLSFARADSDRAVVVIAPRLTFHALAETSGRSLVGDFWADTRVSLPENLAGRRYKNAMTGRFVDLDDAVDLAASLTDYPFVVLVSE